MAQKESKKKRKTKKILKENRISKDQRWIFSPVSWRVYDGDTILDLVLDLGFDDVDRVAALHVERHDQPGERLHDDLHAASRAGGLGLFSREAALWPRGSEGCGPAARPRAAP